MTLEKLGLGSDPLNWSGRKGVLHFILVSEPRFRQFYKMILKLFVNDF